MAIAGGVFTVGEFRCGHVPAGIRTMRTVEGMQVLITNPGI
jgi:hypothetical protein